jgi:hypothetical protein
MAQMVMGLGLANKVNRYKFSILIVFFLTSCLADDRTDIPSFYVNSLWQSNIDLSLEKNASEFPDSLSLIKNEFGKLYYFFGIDYFWIIYLPDEDSEALANKIEKKQKLNLNDAGFVDKFPYKLQFNESVGRAEIYLRESIFDKDRRLSIVIDSQTQCFYVDHGKKIMREYFCKSNTGHPPHDEVTLNQAHLTIYKSVYDSSPCQDLQDLTIKAHFIT